MQANSSRPRRRRKTADRPPKPYDDFPLYAHLSGNWARKILGQFFYFGRWGRVEKGKMVRLPYEKSWQDAKARYDADKEARYAGRTPRKIDDGAITLGDLCNKFLTFKLRRVQGGELTERSLQEYKSTTDLLIAEFGKKRLVEDLGPDDFGHLWGVIAKRVGVVRRVNVITRVRSVFKYAIDNKLIAEPVVYGSEFQKPSKDVLRRHKAMSAKKLFAAAEVRLILDALAGKEVTQASVDKKTGKPLKVTVPANPVMRAAVLLGINAGAGNTDVANLKFSHLDLDRGWMTYPRGKTGIDRRAPLWMETVTALKTAIKHRPAPADGNHDVVLLAPGGERLVRVSEKSRTDAVAYEFGMLLRSLKINDRKGLGYYSLRHTFATTGLQVADRDAVRSLMGQVEGDVLAAYDETGPSDERLRRVTDHVRGWLFAKTKPK